MAAEEDVYKRQERGGDQLRPEQAVDAYGKREHEIALVGKEVLVEALDHHPLGMVVSTHFRCGKGVKRGLKNGALPFNID